MLRITEINEDEKTVTLRLDGKIIGEWVSDLEKVCLSYREEKDKTVVLDLSEVTFIDNCGVLLLEKITDEQIQIRNSSLFIKTLLQGTVD